MKLHKVKLCRYRCFGDDEQTIYFDDLTALIGNNSSGKTAALSAINKIFSNISGERNLQRSDFYIDKGTSPERIEQQDLYIEAVFGFNELDNDTKQNYEIPPFFESLVVDRPDGTPYLRIRLEASWEKSTNIEGSIDSKTYFITCPESQEITNDNRSVASRHDLDRIRMIYVPAVRDPSKQLRNVSGTMMHQIMNSINWSTETQENVKTKIQQLNNEFEKEKGIKILKNTIHSQWKDYDSDERYCNAELKLNNTNIEASIKRAEITFSPTITEKEYSIDEMGDGLRSLFYISMVDSILNVESIIRDELINGTESKAFMTRPPIITIVAVEEPENHIAPHLMGKLINKLNDIAEKKSSQTVITSHSPAIVKRIPPEKLRYFRLDKNTLASTVRNISLPSKEKLTDQYKYIKEAVRAYPELYFAKLVILGEGDSEEIVLPRYFDTYQKNIDASGISVVPLGGRYVNHLWRLLNDLEIPHITLLDLDKERAGGGWGRIKYVLKQLIESGYSRNDVLGVLSSEQLDKMHEWDITKETCLQSWVDFLEKYNVFFTTPLDLDFLMLEHYEDNYKATIEDSEGPYITGKGEIKELEIESPSCVEYMQRITTDIRYTLKKCGGDGTTYTEEQKKLMVWYTYFFLTRGKPSTHILALSSLDDMALKKNTPSVITKILERAEELIK